jgi:hypothetical protein
MELMVGRLLQHPVDIGLLVVVDVPILVIQVLQELVVLAEVDKDQQPAQPTPGLEIIMTISWVKKILVEVEEE